MTLFARIAAIAFAIFSPAVVHGAEPSTAVVIPFSPPTDKPLTYLYEKIEQKDGKTVTETSVDRYSFTPDGEGFVLSVVPVSSTSDDTNPDAQRMREVVLASMGDRPYSLVINESAEITEFVDGAGYWGAVISALRGQLEAKTDTEAKKQAIRGFLGQLERTPADVRLSMMTQHIQPMVEFALTELDPAKPITTQVETGTLLGGKIMQDIIIKADPPANGAVHVSLTSSIPRREIERLTAQVLDSFKGAADKSNQAQAESALASLKELRSDSVADYQIAQDTGVLQSYQLVRTVVATDQGESRTRVTTTRLTLQK